MLTSKASTYCHIISARAESCEKRAYLLFAIPPHCGMQSCNGGEGRSNDGTASLYSVQPEKSYSTVHTTLGT